MKSLVVYESQFGNTALVAEAIGAGLSEWGEAGIVGVDDAPGELPAGLDLLVIGGPTHAFSMSRAASRTSAIADGAAGTSTGVREWLDRLPFPVPVARIATFSTRQGHSPFTGSAAKSAAKALRDHGARDVEVTDFFVTAKTGPLEDCELERATEWARGFGR